MKEESSIPRRLLVSVALAAPLFVVGWLLMPHGRV
jgi:hypothetical protein